MLTTAPTLIPNPTVVALQRKDLANGKELFDHVFVAAVQDCRAICPYRSCSNLKMGFPCSIFRNKLFERIVVQIVPNFRAIGETIVIPFFDDRYRVARLDRRNLVLLKKVIRKERVREGKKIGGYEDYVEKGYYSSVDGAMAAMLEDAAADGFGGVDEPVDIVTFKKSLVNLKKTILDNMAEFIVEYMAMEKKAAETKKKGGKEKKDDDDE